MPLKDDWANGDLFTPAAANDMADAVNNFLPSPLGQALVDASSRLAAHRAIGDNHQAVLTTSFKYKADSAAPAAGDEGVAVTIEDVPPIVKDGLLQSPNIIDDPNDRASYFNQPLVGAKRIGATFKLSSGVATVSAGIIFWEYPIPTPYQVPNSPLHLIVNRSGWELAVWSGGTNPSTTGTFTAIGSGSFSPTLAQDWNPAVAGTGTLHRIEALIDGTSATIFLPDGSVARVTDSRIASIPANVACWEHYHGAGGAAGKLGFEDIWASTSADLPIGAVDLSSSQSISNKTFTSTTLTSPRIGTSILDSNGNTSALVNATASAVNHLQFYNAPAGGYPILLATGSDASVDLGLRGKGNDGSVLLTDGNGRNIIGFERGSSDAVNFWNLYNSGAAADLAVYANGSDSNIGINIVPKGSGTLKSNGTAVLLNGGALGTPSSGTLTNCTFPTLNQNTTGSAASLTTARKINGTDFNGTAAINPAPDAFLSTMGVSPAWAFVVQSTIGGNQSVLANNSGFFVPIRPRQNISVSSLAWVVGTQSGNYDIGVYDSTGARLWSRGSTAVTTAGTQVAETVTDVSMVAGSTYYIAWSSDTTSSAIKGIGGAGTAELSRSMDGTLAVVSVASVFPLPSTVTIGTSTVNRFPFIALRGTSS
jgi:hypothetical protein